MDIVDKTAPKEIWLNVGNERTYAEAMREGDIYWCHEIIESKDIKYVLSSDYEQLRAKVAELEHGINLTEQAHESALQSLDSFYKTKLDAIYAFPVMARIDVAARDIYLADNVEFRTPTVANIPDIELVVLPPRGEV